MGEILTSNGVNLTDSDQQLLQNLVSLAYVLANQNIIQICVLGLAKALIVIASTLVLY